MAELREDAAEVWGTLVGKFEVHGYFGMRSSRAGLQGVVRGAAWPDDKRERTDVTIMAEGALTDFCNRCMTKPVRRYSRALRRTWPSIKLAAG